MFGCVAHVHIPGQRRVKLDDKSYSCVLFGVSNESKAYRLYDPASKCIVVSCDVVFEEDSCWDWSQISEEESRELEWGDNVFEDNGDSGNEEDATEPNMEEAVPNESMPSSTIPAAAQGGTRRENRRAPEWQKDYVSGAGLGLSDEDEEASNLVLYATLNPITFEEAVVSEKWLEAMKLEIQAIEKNETWELVELPAGAKKIGVK